MEKLTRMQKVVYNYLKSQIKENGFPPSVREICDAIGLSSTSSVHAHLETLAAKGWIKRSKAKNRSIEILEEGFYSPLREVVNVPILGTVAAGSPIYADENVEDTFPIPVEYLQTSSDHFMLRIRGDSMADCGIFNNDLVIVRQQNTATNGDIVVALIDDSATVKTYYKERGRFRLQPENSEYSPIIVDEVTILGIVTGLFRKY